VVSSRYAGCKLAPANVVTPMIDDPGLRRHLDQLCREDDRLRAERASEPLGSPPVSESPDPGVLYRDYNGDAPTAAAEAVSAQDWSGWENWIRGHLNVERRQLAECFAEAMAVYVREKLAERDARITRLEGKVEALLALLGQKPPKLWTP
jgi:hypothetical protein